ncbi:MAG: hypothetical protein H0W47_17205 [Polaromonas sp.]|nr:hypothetical protein [Polaromonas sp.]MBA3595506.1 hypothetical protein [Polaromonas sp.]
MTIDPALTKVAYAKAQLARENIDIAAKDLKVANKTLKEAIPQAAWTK